MDTDIDQIRVVNFLVQKKILKSFCTYHCMRVKQSEDTELELEYDDLKGENPRQKAEDLVLSRFRDGRLQHLLYYLADFWFEPKYDRDPKVLRKTELYKDLSTAAQMLWRDRNARAQEQSVQIFEWLAEKVDEEAFGPAWTVNKTALKGASSLGPVKSVEELTSHLVRCRELYRSAQLHREEHRWIDTRRTLLELEELQPDYGDVSDLLHGLRDNQEVSRLQRLLDVIGTGYFHDSHLPWTREYPYQRLRRLGSSITPVSSMDQVQKELRRLLEQETILGEESDDLKRQLESDEQRLLTDVFLYPVQLTAETARTVEKIFLEKARLPKPEEVKGRFPRDEEALLLLVLGEPEAASDIWEEAQRNHPRDGRLAHCQGLLHLAQAHAVDPHADREKFVESWRRAISHWAVATADTSSEYWIQWGRERSQVYGRDFVFTSVTHLGGRIREYLKSLLQGQQQDGDTEKDNLDVTRQELVRELWIEVNAVRLSKILGGIVLEPGRIAWFGPLWMTHFELKKPLARYMADAASDGSLGYHLPEGHSPQEILRRLRWYFSSLKKAAVLLEGDSPAPRAALEALKPVDQDVLDDDCGDLLCPVHGEGAPRFEICCLHSGRFADENPAYGRLPSPGEQIREDALRLAVEAHWCLVREQIRDGGIRDLKTLQDEWQNLSQLAHSCQHDEGVKDRLLTLVLAETRLQPGREMHLTESIKLLEFSLGALAGKEPHRGALSLKTRLAETLEQRAMTKLRQGDISGTEGDLKRALAMAPHLHQIRGELAYLWSNLATNVYHADRFMALDYLRQANQLIEAGQKAFPGSEQLEELRNWITRSQQNLIHSKAMPEVDVEATEPSGTASDSWRLPGDDKPRIRLYAQGKRLEREGRLEQALNTFRQGLERFPEDVDFQTAAIDTLLATAWRLAEEKKHPESLDLIAQWRPLLSTSNSRLERQLALLAGWPLLAPCLKDSNQELLYELRDYKELLLPFSAKHRASVVVSVEIRGEDLCMSAPLPLFSVTGTEAGLTNLLRTSRETLLVKVAAAADSRLSLKIHLPLRLLDGLGADWFVPAVYQLKGFADLSREQLTHGEALKAWFQETRAAFSHELEKKSKPSGSRKRIEKILRKKKLRLTKDDTIRMSSGLQITMELLADGLRLWAPVAPLPATDRHNVLRRLVELNADLERTKLTLDEDDVLLSAEFPYIEEDTVLEALEQIERNAGALHAELT